MEFPSELRAAVEELAEGQKQDKLRSIVRALSDRYRKQSGSGKALLTDDLEASVYAAVRMPATFGAAASAIEYAAECLPRTDITSVLDVGAGSGAASWAAVNVFTETEKLTCFEREGAMRRVGEQLMNGAGSDVLRGARWLSGDLLGMDDDLRADLVISSYVINELSEKDRPRAIEKLWAAADKLLVIVEPGTPSGFEVIRSAREQLIGMGAHIAAPCPHMNECPMAADDWCHFTCRVARSRLHKLLKEGDAPFEDEKYSYIALTKQPCVPAAARVLRHPYTEKGRITLELCTDNGKRTVTAGKKDAALFKAARKARCGDSLEVRDKK